MRGRGALGFGGAGRERKTQEEVKKKKQKLYLPCCTSRGRRRGNSVAQNVTISFPLFFLNFPGISLIDEDSATSVYIKCQ
jgi:hypothetical protein